eukprot:Skav230489  [mRNA]  locus=scaffold1182:11909:17629:+ [translate_table: standard]
MTRKKHNKQRDTSEETEPRHRPVFGPSRRQEEKDKELSRSREERGKGKGGGGKGKGDGEGRREGKGGGRKEEAWNKASYSSYGGSSSSKQKSWQPRYTRQEWAQWEEDQWEAHQLKEMELQAETGWVPGLRGRESRSQRKLRRAWDPEVQGRKEKYIQKGEWPEKKPEDHKEMKEGSQRWRSRRGLKQSQLQKRQRGGGLQQSLEEAEEEKPEMDEVVERGKNEAQPAPEEALRPETRPRTEEKTETQSERPGKKPKLDDSESERPETRPEDATAALPLSGLQLPTKHLLKHDSYLAAVADLKSGKLKDHDFLAMFNHKPCLQAHGVPEEGLEQSHASAKEKLQQRFQDKKDMAWVSWKKITDEFGEEEARVRVKAGLIRMRKDPEAVQRGLKLFQFLKVDEKFSSQRATEQEMVNESQGETSAEVHQALGGSIRTLELGEESSDAFFDNMWLGKKPKGKKVQEFLPEAPLE